MELFEATSARHSYRGAFLAKAADRATLTQIVDAGIRAPSGFNAQTTEFVIVDDESVMEKLREIVDAKPLASAPAAIVVLMRQEEPRNGLYFGIEDYAAASENILLAITALGLATVWIDGALRREKRAEKIADVLGVPVDREVRVLLPVGYPAEKREQNTRHAFGERAWFNRYGNS